MRPRRTLVHPRQTRPASQTKKGHARMRPRMAFCIGIAGRDQPSASPCLVFYIQLYTQKCTGKERNGRCEEIVTHIDAASSTCTNLHHAIGRLWTGPPTARSCCGSYRGWVVGKVSGEATRTCAGDLMPPCKNPCRFWARADSDIKKRSFFGTSHRGHTFVGNRAVVDVTGARWLGTENGSQASGKRLFVSAPTRTPWRSAAR